MTARYLFSKRLGEGRWGRNRGAVFVESAIVFSVFVLFLAGVFDLGWVMWKRTLLTESVIKSARQVLPLPAGSDCVSVAADNFRVQYQRFGGTVAGSCVRVQTNPLKLGTQIELAMVSAEVTVPCLWCRIVGHPIRLRAASVVPLQVPNQCTTTNCPGGICQTCFF